MDREIYHTLYVSFTIIIMCSLCITSITNINARLSAGGRDKTSVRFSVHVCRCRVNMSVFAYMYVSCKESQEDSIRGLV